eukprot:49557_1
MEDLIEFTLMLKQLNDNEVMQFVTESMKHFGADLIGKLFFNYLMNDSHRTEIKAHTQCAMDIINARKDKPNLTTSYDCIDQLPSTLIAECASYLPLKEYVLFSRCNRQVFVSTNKPFRLYELPLSVSELRRCPRIMSKFKSVKSIRIHINTIGKFINQSIWEHSSFDKVRLFNCSLDKPPTAFLNSKMINLNQINHLQLSGFGSCFSDYSCEAFCELLSHLQNIKRLSWTDIFLIQGEFKWPDSRTISQWLPNLTSFSFSTDADDVSRALGKRIVKAIGHQLQSLACPCSCECKMGNSSNLKDLSIGYGSLSQNCLASFSNVTALQSMDIGCYNENVLKSCIDFMFTKQKAIQQVKITTYPKYFKYIFDQIQSVLFDSYSEGVQRDKLFISLETYQRCTMDDVLPVVEVFKLLNTLASMHINDFLIQ